MKQIFTIIIIIGSLAPCFAQGNTAKYDSTRNFLGGDVYQYVGQELRIAELPEAGREMGYTGFVVDYKNDKWPPTDNAYKGFGVSTTYDSVVGHFFTVLEVIPDPKAASSPISHGSKFYLKLKDKQNGGVCYFEYDSARVFRSSLPFYLTGYLAKQKALALGQEFVFSNKWFSKSMDYETGAPLKLVTGEKWKCVDIVVDKRTNELSMLIKNTAGQKQVAAIDWAFKNHNAGTIYTAAEADNYRKIYGTDFDAILAGNLRPGWGKTMCSLAWGDPDHVNPTTTSAGRTEQWVYKDNKFLYFDEHGKLTTIQE